MPGVGQLTLSPPPTLGLLEMLDIDLDKLHLSSPQAPLEDTTINILYV